MVWCGLLLTYFALLKYLLNILEHTYPLAVQLHVFLEVLGSSVAELEVMVQDCVHLLVSGNVLLGCLVF